MKRVTFNLLFYIKRSKILKNGEVPVFLRITVEGKRVEISIKRSIKESLWDTARNKAKGNSAEAKQLNDYLNSVKGQIFNHHRQLQEDNKVITAKVLRNSFLGVAEKRWLLKDLYHQHNEEMKMLIDKDFARATWSRYNTAFNTILEFMKWQFKSDEILLSEIDHSFISKFEFFLKSEKNCQHNSAMKHMSSLRKIINIAISNEYIKKDPLAKYKISIKETNREFLTEFELESLTNQSFPTTGLTQVRDAFLFQCYTGLAYIDLATLTNHNITIGIDGKKWIFTERTKTKASCRIPILPIITELINKYKKHACQKDNKVIPVISNQKMNENLKEIAELCGINKNLKTHMARHTFATTVTLANEIPISVVSKMLGHKKLQTTSIYAKVLDTSVSKQMEKVALKFAS